MVFEVIFSDRMSRLGAKLANELTVPEDRVVLLHDQRTVVEQDMAVGA
jgi:hypothetical protein